MRSLQQQLVGHNCSSSCDDVLCDDEHLWLPACILQEEQRAEHKAAKAATANLSVMDKSTFASRQQALFTGDTIKAGFQETVRPGEVGSKGLNPVVTHCKLYARCLYNSSTHLLTIKQPGPIGVT